MNDDICGPSYCEGPQACPRCDATCAERDFLHVHGPAAGPDRPPILGFPGHDHGEASTCAPTCPAMQRRR